jgi:hypothetical protein
VRDAGLCHGSAGVAHIFHRLLHATGEDLFENASRRWYRLTLNRRRPARPVAGFPAWSTDDAGRIAWRPDPGVLEGAAGVALTLLSATTPLEPAWDRALLLSGF